MGPGILSVLMSGAFVLFGLIILFGLKVILNAEVCNYEPVRAKPEAEIQSGSAQIFVMRHDPHCLLRFEAISDRLV